MCFDPRVLLFLVVFVIGLVGGFVGPADSAASV